MADIQSHYIDFRDEHRIYFIEGMLMELVGMIADTDYDEWNNDSPSTDPSPVTWYKLIVHPELMFDGGHYEEGCLPPIFAHRGDTISTHKIVKYLLENIYYNTDSPIVLLEELQELDLCVDKSDMICDIAVRLFSVLGDGYRIETELQTTLGYPLMFIHPHQKDGKKGLMFSIDDEKKHYTFKQLATAFGAILYALREFYERDIEIVSIREVKKEYTPEEYEAELPKSYRQFLRMIEIAAEKEKRYWNEFK